LNRDSNFIDKFLFDSTDAQERKGRQPIKPTIPLLPILNDEDRKIENQIFNQPQEENDYYFAWAESDAFNAENSHS